MTYAHIGLDLTGPNGGVVRIDDLVVEDVTNIFIRKLMNWVDVRDYGGLGNGSTNDTAAFLAADADAKRRTILMPSGVFRLTSDVSISNRIRFEGTVSMPANGKLTLTRSSIWTLTVRLSGPRSRAASGRCRRCSTSPTTWRWTFRGVGST